MNRRYKMLADSELEAARMYLDLASAARDAGNIAAQLEHLAQVFTHCLRAGSYTGLAAEIPAQEANHALEPGGVELEGGAGPKTRDPQPGGAP